PRGQRADLETALDRDVLPGRDGPRPVKAGLAGDQLIGAAGPVAQLPVPADARDRAKALGVGGEEALDRLAGVIGDVVALAPNLEDGAVRHPEGHAELAADRVLRARGDHVGDAI